MNNLSAIATVVLAVVSLIGLMTGVMAWLYRRGGRDKAFTDALDRNTKANNDLSQELVTFKSVVIEMFHELDKRVVVLEETKRRVTGSADAVALMREHD